MGAFSLAWTLAHTLRLVVRRLRTLNELDKDDERARQDVRKPWEPPSPDTLITITIYLSLF